MFKYLLVPSTGSDLDRPVVEMAVRSAHPSSAHIEFLHVRMDVKQVMVMLAGSGMNGAPKQALNVALGSVTPRSVPATFAV